MAAFVLDGSIALAWFLPGERSSRTEALLDQATEAGALAPGLWLLEVANVILVAERKKRITQAQRVRALTALAKLPIRIDTETAGRAWNSTFDLALAHGLTVYDAGYLDLSLRSGLPLATPTSHFISAGVSFACHEATGIQPLGFARCPLPAFRRSSQEPS